MVTHIFQVTASLRFDDHGVFYSGPNPVWFAGQNSPNPSLTWVLS